MADLSRRLRRVEAAAWRCPGCGARCACASGGADERTATIAAVDAELDRLVEELRARATRTTRAGPEGDEDR